MPNVVTANRLRSGAVVYLGHQGSWVDELRHALVAADKPALGILEVAALAAVTANDVTAVYAMDVRIVDGRPEPVSVRERIRAAGAPTI
jgi:sulfite reductase (NADPH) hemoprotein beta-component